MKSQKGITLTSLVIYIVVVLIVVGILGVISANFQGNIKEIYAEGTNNVEIDKFNLYFLKEVKKQGNKINTISNNEILFTEGNKYVFSDNEKCIYLNDSIKIAENIENCIFSSDLVSEKTIITVTIKAINGQEKIIEYVLTNEEIVDNLENESDYINYTLKGWDVSKLNDKTPVYIKVVDNEIELAPIPKGFEISGLDTENTIEKGLVIYEMTEEEKLAIDWTNSEEVERAKQTYNQFVWIPVADDLESSYSYSASYTEPIKLTSNFDYTESEFDSKEVLDYMYGEGYYNYQKDFNYYEEYGNMVSSVNKYNGFYIGKYETTIDNEGKIGSKYNTEVLTAIMLLKEGKNSNTNDEYHCRWYGLYNLQKNADVSKNKNIVQPAMIYGILWDKTMDYIRTQKVSGYTTYDVDTATASWHNNSNINKSGQANNNDVALNIWDLEGNAYEWTQEAEPTNKRALRGGVYNNSFCASNRVGGYPGDTYNYYSSRMVLYIK